MPVTRLGSSPTSSGPSMTNLSEECSQRALHFLRVVDLLIECVNTLFYLELGRDGVEVCWMICE